VTVAQLDAKYPPVLVLFLRNRETGDPGLALADPETGVYRRDAMATAGAILNNTIVIRYLDPGGGAGADRTGAGAPRSARTAVVALNQRLPSPIATYVAANEATSGVTLTVRENGTATLDGLPQSLKSPLDGAWSEASSVLTVRFEGTATAEWRITRDGLQPLRWDPKRLGDQGFAFVRSPVERN
jgi:hypothetical protein